MAYHCFTGLLSSLGACEVAACGGVACGGAEADGLAACGGVACGGVVSGGVVPGDVSACGGVAPGIVSADWESADNGAAPVNGAACGGAADNEAVPDGGVTTDCDWVSSMVLFNTECKINKILRQVYGISNAMPRLPAITIPEALQALISMLMLVSNLLINMCQRRFSGFIKLPVSIII